jgi:hypothetical protein
METMESTNKFETAEGRPGANENPSQSIVIASPVDYESQIPGALILAEDVVTMRYEFHSKDLPAGWEAEVNGSPKASAAVGAQGNWRSIALLAPLPLQSL